MLSLYIAVHPSDRHWLRSAQLIHTALAKGIDNIASEPITLNLIAPSDISLPSDLKHNPVCIIFHWSDPEARKHLPHWLGAYWVTASGGNPDFSPSVDETLLENPRIIFPSVYEKEGNFTRWLEYWMGQSGTHPTFAETQNALLSGLDEIDRLCTEIINGLRLLLGILDLYAAAQNGSIGVAFNSTTEPLPLSDANAWLSSALASILDAAPSLLDMLAAESDILAKALSHTVFPPAPRRRIDAAISFLRPAASYDAIVTETAPKLHLFCSGIVNDISDPIIVSERAETFREYLVYTIITLRWITSGRQYVDEALPLLHDFRNRLYSLVRLVDAKTENAVVEVSHLRRFSEYWKLHAFSLEDFWRNGLSKHGLIPSQEFVDLATDFLNTSGQMKSLIHSLVNGSGPSLEAFSAIARMATHLNDLASIWGDCCSSEIYIAGLKDEDDLSKT